MAPMHDEIPHPNRHVAVDISSTDFALPGKGTVRILVGVAGDVVLEDGAGTEITYPSALVTALGLSLVGEFVTVIKTGTTATGMICQYRALP